MALIVILALLAAGLALYMLLGHWAVNSVSNLFGKTQELPVTKTPDLRPEVERLAEKIRSAHLNKDINKFLSCYSSTYPSLGQLENSVLELWKKYDVKEVNYRISNIQRLGDRRPAPRWCGASSFTTPAATIITPAVDLPGPPGEEQR